jgi:hypothetical protein
MAFYAGLVVVLAGLASVLLPLRFLGIRSRKQALLLALSGLAFAAIALLWPVTGAPVVAGGSTELDRVLPQYDRSERHQIRVHSQCESVRRAVDEVTFADIRGFSTLMSLRAGRTVRAQPRPILTAMTGPGAGFTLLANTGGEFVAGNVGRPWKNERPLPIRDADAFRQYSGGGYSKIAFNLQVVPDEPGWCKVSTETRILATDEPARRAFTRYWRVIYPGSAFVRVLWLDAVERRLHGGTA